MAMNVFLSTTLRDAVAGYNPVEGLLVEWTDGLTVTGLVERIGLPVPEIRIVMVNGRRAEMDAFVRDGDRVGFFPAVGGG